MMTNTEWLLLQLVADILVIWLCWEVCPYWCDFWYPKFSKDDREENKDEGGIKEGIYQRRGHCSQVLVINALGYFFTVERRTTMEQRRNFEWAQNKIDELTGTEGPLRHATQTWPNENRAQRRERERKERRIAKKVKA